MLRRLEAQISMQPTLTETIDDHRHVSTEVSRAMIVRCTSRKSQHVDFPLLSEEHVKVESCVAEYQRVPQVLTVDSYHMTL